MFLCVSHNSHEKIYIYKQQTEFIRISFLHGNFRSARSDGQINPVGIPTITSTVDDFTSAWSDAPTKQWTRNLNRKKPNPGKAQKRQSFTWECPSTVAGNLARFEREIFIYNLTGKIIIWSLWEKHKSDKALLVE